MNEAGLGRYRVCEPANVFDLPKVYLTSADKSSAAAARRPLEYHHPRIYERPTRPHGRRNPHKAAVSRMIGGRRAAYPRRVADFGDCINQIDAMGMELALDGEE
jgi:hypothetical protein